MQLRSIAKRFRDNSPVMEPVCRLMRATGLVPPRLWRHLPFSGTIDFSVAGRGVRMLHFGAEIENSLFWAGYGNDWEATSLRLWELLARQSDVVFDVGANTGLYALAAAAANPAARVHAFEPMPEIARRLQANVALNPWPIAVHAAAVSDRSGSARIRAMTGRHEYSASFEHMEWMDEATAVEVLVPLVSLSDVMADTGQRPALIKMDVERHEPAALAGLWPGLGDGPLPLILIEILDDEVAAAVTAQIAPKGYVSFVVAEGIGVHRKPLCAEPGFMNWLLVPPVVNGLAAELLASGGIVHSELVRRAGVRP